MTRVTNADLEAHVDRCDWCRNHPSEPCKRFDSLLYRSRTQGTDVPLAPQPSGSETTCPTKEAMKKPTVYLIMQPSVSRGGRMPNLQPLGKFGDVVTLVLSGEYPTYHAEQVLEKVDRRLDDCDPNTDYFVWAGGDTLAAVMVGALLADRFASRSDVSHITWLRFERDRKPDGSRDNDSGDYVPIRVPLFVRSVIEDPGSQVTLLGAVPEGRVD